MIDKNVQNMYMIVHVKEDWGRHGHAGIWILSSSERYFQHEEIKSVSPSSHVMFCLFYRCWWNFHIKQLFLFIFETTKIVTYRKMSLIAVPSHVKDKNSIFTAYGEDIIFL